MNPEPTLEALGIRAGQRVRFRRGAGLRWHDGVATRIEKDGSLGLRDAKGATRAIRLERVEVRTAGPRGTPRWERLLDVAARTEQLRLF
ncbi:MAG: hypothetical protein CYG61_06850 [Actinobacteria bacterium]|nr:MAG: hypothetical protein CYG61_06850 [Actinomycetota bacterium]